MPAKKRKSSTTGKTTAKKAKTKTKTDSSTTTIPDRSRSANTSLISSDPLYQAKKRGKQKSDPITIDDDSSEVEFVDDSLYDVLYLPSSSNRFYSNGTGNQASSPVQQNLNKVFDLYRGMLSSSSPIPVFTTPDKPRESPDKIFIDGAQKYLSDLSIALDEVVHLALCDLLSCPSIGEFDREAFVAGWTAASTPSANNTVPPPPKPLDSTSRQQAYISTLRKRLTTDPAYFKTVYRSSFKLAKQNEQQRSVPLDAAIEFWKMFFTASSGGIEWNTKSTAWLDLWCEFYENQGKRPVNKDLWNMVGELVQRTKEPGGESLDWWTEDGAWPMAVDDFVAWVKEKRKAEGGGDEMDTD